MTLVREYARKRKNYKRLTSLLYLCAVEILRKLKSVCNSSVVLVKVCGCTILPAVFCSEGLDELWVIMLMSIFPFATILWNFSSSELFHLAVLSVVLVALGIV
jgi:hypothetical protein